MVCNCFRAVRANLDGGGILDLSEIPIIVEIKGVNGLDYVEKDGSNNEMEVV